MVQRLGSVALLVRDYDEAIEYFTGVLGFALLEDVDQGRKRWVVVSPLHAEGVSGASLVLARPTEPDQLRRIGDQTGGRVFLFLETDDFWGDYNGMKERGVNFIEEPRHEPYGMVVVFEDLYGNRWDLLGPTA